LLEKSVLHVIPWHALSPVHTGHYSRRFAYSRQKRRLCGRGFRGDNKITLQKAAMSQWLTATLSEFAITVEKQETRVLIYLYQEQRANR